MPPHFLNDNILAISTLELHRPERDAGCIQNRGGQYFPASSFLQLLYPFTQSPGLPLRFPATIPLNLLIESRSLPSDPYKPLAGLGTPRGAEGRSYVSPLNSNKWSRGSMASLIGCHEICSIIALQCNNPLFYRCYRTVRSQHVGSRTDPSKIWPFKNSFCFLPNRVRMKHRINFATWYECENENKGSL